MSTSSMRVLVAGAINTDLVATMKHAPEAGETITGDSFATYGGGKGANQAVAAARSEAKVALVGAVGDDEFGTARRADLERDEIDTTWIATNLELPSGVALILVETGGENRIAYVPGATRRVTTNACLLALEEFGPSILLATNELPHDALKALFEQARANGIDVVFNATPEPETALDLLQHVTILIVNAVEARILLGTDREVSPQLMVSQVRDSLHVETVILTAGSQGAYAATSERVFHAPAPVVDVVDTTGAGDTFCGAFVAGFLRNTDLEAAMRYAVAASAISVTRAGAQSSIPHRSEVDARLGI